MVADGLSIINADYSEHVVPGVPGRDRAAQLPRQQHRLPRAGPDGDNCLLATKVMVPIDGEVREGVGLLGSPSFEIPRSVERDSQVRPPADRRRAAPPAAPPRTGTTSRTIGAVPAVAMAATSSCSPCSPWSPSTCYGVARAAGDRRRVIAAGLLFTVVYFVLVERAVDGFRPLQPRFCSIYDPYFWRHERYWKLCPTATSTAVQRHAVQERGLAAAGRPGRQAGLRRRLLHSPSGPSSRSATTARSTPAAVIQCHSQEDGAFKSDRSTIGAGCTLGVGAFVHYGVTMGDGAVLAPDSFLMKGEEVPPHARWGGNPARETAEPRRPPTAPERRTARGRDRPAAHGEQPDALSGVRAATRDRGVLARRARRRRVHGDPAVDPRPGARRRRARGAGPRRARGGRCAGWPTSWRCRSARCCWPRTPRCWPHCPASATSSTGYVAARAAGRCPAG